MANALDLPEFAHLDQDLTPGELAWLLGWNVADGRWGRIGMDERAARGSLLFLFTNLQSDAGLEVVKTSSGWLQQRLMSLRRGAFEEIQRHAPFSRHAQRNMGALFRAWKEEGEARFAQAWEGAFPVGWETAREPQEPIRIIGEGGDRKERALDVLGAPDAETRAAAEWWYKFYTCEPGWMPGLHVTTRPDESGTHYSGHEIEIPPDIRRWIYFRLPR